MLARAGATEDHGSMTDPCGCRWREDEAPEFGDRPVLIDSECRDHNPTWMSHLDNDEMSD